MDQNTDVLFIWNKPPAPWYTSNKELDFGLLGTLSVTRSWLVVTLSVPRSLLLVTLSVPFSLSSVLAVVLKTYIRVVLLRKVSKFTVSKEALWSYVSCVVF